MFNRFKKKGNDSEKKVSSSEKRTQNVETREISHHSAQYKLTQTRKVTINGVVTEETVNTVDGSYGIPPLGGVNSMFGRSFSLSDSPNNFPTKPSLNTKYSSIASSSLPSLPTSYKPPYTTVRSDAQPFRTAMATTTSNSPKNLPKVEVIDDLSKVMDIKVMRDGKFYDNDGKIPTYSTHGRNRGSLLIINNIMFEKEDHLRKGAQVDEQNVTKLFKALKFTVESYKNLKKQKMVDTLEKYTKKTSLKNVDINVVLIMSHGTGTKNGITQIAGTDGQPLDTSVIIDMFDNISCPNLKNKPKIFIFQCCRGSEDQIQKDTIGFDGPKKQICDMLLAYSTIPGYVSHRNEIWGTYYIQAICKVFMEHAFDTHVEDLLKIVEEKMTKLTADTKVAQTSSYENRGFKRCFLHP